MIGALTVRALLLVLLVSPLAYSQSASVGPVDAAGIFRDRCAKCHGDQGEGISAAMTIAGPNIQAVHNPGDVMMAMEVGPSHMPSFAHVLTIDEMNAVANYVTQRLAVIPLSGGRLQEGGELFRIYCATCHRTAVRGGALAYVGTNALSLVGVSPALVAGAVRWGPGPMPSFPPSVISDTQLDSITKYVEFAEHPPAQGGNPLNFYGPVPEGVVAWVVIFCLIAVTGWIERGEKG